MSNLNKELNRKMWKELIGWIIVAGVFVIVLYCCIVYIRNTVTMPTPESIALYTIRKNYETCDHKVVYGSDDNPFVFIKDKPIFLAERGCR